MERCLSPQEESQIKESIREGETLNIRTQVAIDHLNTLELTNMDDPELKKDISDLLSSICQTDLVLYEKCSPESLDPKQRKVYATSYRIRFLDSKGDNVACKIFQRILFEALKNIDVPDKSLIMLGSIFNENATLPISAFLLNQSIDNIKQADFTFISDFDWIKLQPNAPTNELKSELRKLVLQLPFEIRFSVNSTSFIANLDFVNKTNRRYFAILKNN